MYNTKEDMIFALINEIGLSINNNGSLFDQDTGQIIYFGGKEIKCSIDPTIPVYKSDMSVIFDPLNDMKLMTTILGYYLEKERSMGDYYPITYSFNDRDKRGPSNMSVQIQTPDRGIVEVVSGFYYNRCLKISDIILRMGGQESNLSNFDHR